MKSLRCSDWNKKANGPRNSHFQRSCESIGIEKETSQMEEDSEGELSQKVREEKEKTKAYTL